MGHGVRPLWLTVVLAPLLVLGADPLWAQVVMDRSDRQFSDRQRNTLFLVIGQVFPDAYQLRLRAIEPRGDGRYCGQISRPGAQAADDGYVPFYVDIHARRGERADTPESPAAARIAAACGSSLSSQPSQS